MNGGTRVIAFGPSSTDAARDEILLTQEAQAPGEELLPESSGEEEWEEPAPAGRFWLAPALAIGAVLAWSGLFLWAMQSVIWQAREPAQWVAILRDWTVPVLLIAVLAVLALRNSRREALRFGDAARLLRSEAMLLEERLGIVNRELSLAREFIASQSRDLEALGRVATERLSKESDRLQSLIRDNHDRVDAIGTVSTAALENMERLRGQLPVIASSAKDVTNNIGNAGRAAHAQLQNMVSGFQRLNDFGQASERQVTSLRGMVEQTLGEFAVQAEKLEEIASNRFAALADRGSVFRSQLEGHEAEALAAIRARAQAMSEELEETRRLLDAHEAESLTSLRARLSALRDEGAAISRALREGETRATEALHATADELVGRVEATLANVAAADTQAHAAAQARFQEISAEAARLEAELANRADATARAVEQRRASLEHEQAQALARLGEQLAQVDAELEQRRTDHELQSARISAHGEAVAERLAALSRKLTEVATHGSEAEATIGRSIQTLADQLAASRTSLAGTDREVEALTNASVRLLELIQASAQHSRDDLPRAIAIAEERLSGLEARLAQARDTAAEANASGESLHSHVMAAQRDLTVALEEVDRGHLALAERSEAHVVALADLKQTLDALADKSAALSGSAQTELADALSTLSRSVEEALSAIRRDGTMAITDLARKLAEDSRTAIEDAIRESAAQSSGQLEQAATDAASVAREATIQLRDQLAKVNELAANLEQRVAQARQRAEEQVDNDFTRRVAVLGEALNSHAIDIAKALSTDVSDTAWTAYLRGDRGIFTRRAVALLDSGDAKAIAQIYERDSDFHEHVSRYIHDFEAMLRQVLSTRDGNALGVTILSSDMGKLYVALAQAIERLRS